MTHELPIQRVEAVLVGAHPAKPVERASGVSEGEIDGSILRCVVGGSFQPFLDALLDHAVISLKAIPEGPG